MHADRLERRAERHPGEQTHEHALVRGHPVPRAAASPRPPDVPDRRERPAVPMREQPRVQPRLDPLPRDLAGLSRELVEQHIPRAMARKVERDHPVQPGARVDILTRPAAHPRSALRVLTDERPVQTVAYGPLRGHLDPVTGRPQHRRDLRRERRDQPRLRRRRAGQPPDRPLAGLRDLGEQRLAPRCILDRDRIVLVHRREAEHHARRSPRAGLGRDHAARVRGEVRELGEVDPPDRIKQAELTLHRVRDLRRRSDEQQVERHALRVARPRADPLTREPAVRALARAQRAHLRELPVEPPRLLPAQREQRLQRREDRLLPRRRLAVRSGVREHHAPPGRREVLDVGRQLAEVPRERLVVAALQGLPLALVLAALLPGDDLLRQRRGRRPRERILPRVDIDAIEPLVTIPHRPPPPLARYPGPTSER